MTPVLNADQLQAVLADSFPLGDVPTVELVEDDVVVVSQRVHEGHGRPGGTVSGPTMMALADLAAWLVTMAHVGPVLLAVTTSLHIDFLRKPTLTDVVARARLIKLGKRLSVSDVEIFSRGSEKLVAKAQVTYSLPSTPSN
ncbi:MAG: PaaI family thioesterase [Acidobacteriota bacterium]|nr:PaaI family thioesterase [Acidobacteriota bacterium]MDE3222425.1 PaaI family thioesterase [Acidobacteriota bacterium]